ALYVYNKRGVHIPGATRSLNGSAGLFKSGLADPAIDPRCIYDQYTQRFVVAAIRTNPPLTFLAISETSNPGGPWKALVPQPYSFLDFTGLGYDDTNYYVTARAGTNAVIRRYAKGSIDAPPEDRSYPQATVIMPATSYEHPSYQYFVEART